MYSFRSLLLLIFLLPALEVEGQSASSTERFAGSAAIASADFSEEWKSGFLICWRGSVEENIRSAKALGYRYVNETCQNATRILNYKNWPQSKGMRFYLDNPEFAWVPQMGKIEPSRLAKLKAQNFGPLFQDYPKVSQRVKYQWLTDLKTFDRDAYEMLRAIYERYYCIVDGTTPFPENLALGWKFAGGDARLMPDWQQQAVIDSVVSRVVALAYERQSIENDYLFTGITMDVPEKWAEFDRPPAYDSARYDDYKLDCSLSGYALPGIRHDYTTFREGWMRFMLTLRERLGREFPDRKIRFLLEPWRVWRDGYCGRWSYWIDTLHGAPFLTLDEKKKIAGDLIMMEGNFIDQFYDPEMVSNIVGSGLITLDQMAITSPNLKDRYYEPGNPATHLNYIGLLAMKGGWFNSYGRFDSRLTSVSDRLPQLTLARALVNWQNLGGVPVAHRSWNEMDQVFDSPTGHADRNVIYGREPRSGKLFVVWVTREGSVKLPEGLKLTAARKVNVYYEEFEEGSEDGIDDLEIAGDMVKLGKGGALNTCYILTLSDL